MDNNEKLSMSKEDALNKAYEQDLDLIQVGENNDTAICKILNYSKLLYNQEKLKKKEKKQNKVDIKEIRLGRTISDNDLNVKLKNCYKMIVKDKDKVKISIRFKGRETKLMDTDGIALMQKIKDSISEYASCSNIKIDGNSVVMIAEPLKK